MTQERWKLLGNITISESSDEAEKKGSQYD
jgi:hypothetical protein